MYPIHSFKQKKEEKGEGAEDEEVVNCEIPFNSTNKFNLIIWNLSASEEPQDNTPARRNKVVIMKGAPERILGYCSHILINGEEVKLTEYHEE